LKSDFERFDFMNYPQLTFEQPDLKTFRNLQLAFDALAKGGNAPCILNAANEIAVAAFLNREVGFLEMSDLIEETLEKATFIAHPSLEDYIGADEEARTITTQLIKRNK
jgi:1-deoxy-D-xylulose-5-phosphate reductoisomerase